MSEDEPKAKLPGSWWLTEAFATLVSPTRRATITMLIQTTVTFLAVAWGMGPTVGSLLLGALAGFMVILANSLGWTQGMLETYQTLREAAQQRDQPPEGPQ